MLCPECGFNNLDYLKKCVRCGKLLRAPELPAIDPHPPRAKGADRARRLLWRMRRRRGFRWRESNGEAVVTPEREWTVADWLAVLLLPGFGQLRRGRLLFGIVCLAVWSGGLCGMLRAGTESVRFRMMLIALAAYASVSAMRCSATGFSRFSRRISRRTGATFRFGTWFRGPSSESRPR